MLYYTNNIQTNIARVIIDELDTFLVLDVLTFDVFVYILQDLTAPEIPLDYSSSVTSTSRAPAPSSNNKPTTKANEDNSLGFTNVGTTCYANAAIQCILSKALSHALLDPESTQIFRRYSSNPVLFALG